MDPQPKRPQTCPRCNAALYYADSQGGPVLRCIKGHIAFVYDALERKWLVPHAPDGRANARI